ncbi:fumarylacetoacetate hydrolase family protein [Pigmentiphaga sp. CHJ604]|uniref:fumarylacetoacetate hydrolase family protein n=1 Tax=Pigmentiphaga sp. CHJ604 TaxID=3081984 RepID=UPI0030CAE49A
MKICWYDDQRLGVVDNGRVHDVTAALAALPPARYPAAPGDLLVAHLDRLRAEAQRLLPGATSKPLDQARFLSPVANPNKIIGVPVNYDDHVAEANADKATFTDRFQGSIEQQGLFLKATSSLVGPAEGVHVRFPERLTHHELELAVVIGSLAANVGEDDALNHVAGYAIALDMTVRGPEDRSMRKSVDSYSVLGPWLVTADEIADPQALDILLTVNGELRQQSNTAQMIMRIRRQIAWASSFYTLYPGDIIMTGTCAGVGPVVPGDVVHCSIQGVGTMDVPIHAATAEPRGPVVETN